MTLNDDTFASNLGLLTKDGKFNKIAELLSDKTTLASFTLDTTEMTSHRFPKLSILETNVCLLLSKS